MKYCVKCGKPVADDTEICTNCGCYADGIKMQPKEPYSIKARTARILGAFAAFILPLGFILGIPAIILALVSKQDTNGILYSDGKVGLYCGLAGVLIDTVLLFILMFV